MAGMFQKYIENIDDAINQDDEEFEEAVYNFLDIIGEENKQFQTKLTQRIVRRFENLCRQHHFDITDAYRMVVDPIYHQMVSTDDIDFVQFILFKDAMG